ncbi:MAG: peptidoglycan bridge formation glycyltransferase FemA/FemB family protein, partial [Clostridia bacterium]|nr:peptidoglycan bridge formation glycyltransferase FemA/FemB family protein [Clostridia bacterium]
MYRSRLIGPEERALFNKFVASADKGHILQSYEWGEIKGRGAWRPARILVENEQGEPCAALTILQRGIPGTGKLIFYAPRGPVGDVDNWELMDFLFSEAKKLAQSREAVFLKIDPDIPAENEKFRDYLKSRKFVNAEKGEGFEGVQPKFVFRLDITLPEEVLFKNFHEKTRYNIRLALKKGVEIKEECTKKDLPVFYKLLKETTERDKFLVRPYDYFADLWDYLTPRGYLKLFMAYYEGRPIAGTLAFLFGDKAWYIYGASSNSHRNVMPNYLLQWTMIKWAQANNCTMYDFRGVPGHLTEENPLYGLYRFKKGFNGVYTEFVGEYDLVFS